MQYRKDIQGLRAIAFLFVYIFHINSNWLPGGFIGVDMFFVISGFLVSSIILSKKEKGKFNIINFYQSRFKRIVPAYYFLLLFVTIAALYFYLPLDLGFLKIALLSAFLFVSNIYFGLGDSYFGAKLHENPILHTWSLGIEMQFYFFLPLLLIFIRRKALPFVICAIILAITLYVEYVFHNYGFSSKLYFSLLSRMPEFLIGVLFALVPKNIGEKINVWISLLGVALLVYSIFFINENSVFPGMLAFIPCIGIGIILLSSDNFVTSFLSSKPLVFIGELSYSLYLWHWPLMAFLRYKYGVHEGYEFSIFEILIITALTMIISWISYSYVENMFRKVSDKKFLYTFSPICVCLLLVIFSTAYYSEKWKIPKEYTQATFAINSHNSTSVDTIGALGAIQPTVFLIGDSHANVLKPFFGEVCAELGVKVRTLTCDSYPALRYSPDGIAPLDLKYYNNSRNLVQLTSDIIHESKVIIIVSNGLDKTRKLPESIGKLADSLNANQRIILVKTFPILDKNPLRINRSSIKSSDEKFTIKDRSKNARLIDSLAQKHKNIYVFDLSNSRILNNAPYNKNNELMYYDDRHLNVFGAKALAVEKSKEFRDIFNKSAN
ncbi:acyltransferase family protein [Sphingobacterium sp. Lzh-3]|uniref:acyltransferase family protein n=1 Tax=Sphingobacterium sp. Lzh-3 TaxID=3382150 RepID=UPI00398CAFAF